MASNYTVVHVPGDDRPTHMETTVREWAEARGLYKQAIEIAVPGDCVFWIANRGAANEVTLRLSMICKGVTIEIDPHSFMPPGLPDMA